MKTNLAALQSTPPWEWPEDAGTVLLDVLRGSGFAESDLSLAVDLAGELTVINDDLVDALLGVLRRSDESEETRGKAAISLGAVLEQADLDGFGDPDDVPISERTFRTIQKSLQELYRDAGVPEEVRRRILEAAVRAPQDWHKDAVRAAYASDDDLWKLTAVFGMRFVRGFTKQILEALDSPNPDIHYEAVLAAGNWEVEAAWPHVANLVASEETDKALLLAAIDAAGSIRPQEAGRVLADLMDSDDEDIAEAAHEAVGMAESLLGMDLDEDDEDLD
jgi:HEAT repeats